jgi:hypothetical protein
LVERETLDSDEIEMVVRGEELPPVEVKQMLQARMASENGGKSEARVAEDESVSAEQSSTESAGGDGSSSDSEHA